MSLICSHCRTEIATTDINIHTDLAKCASCGTLHKASSLLGAVPKEVSAAPPLGSQMTLERRYDGTTSIEYPAKGFTASDIFLLLFAIVWIVFVGFWTWGAGQGSVLFALFSLPFWFVGLMMWYGILQGMYEVQELLIEARALTLIRKGFLGSKATTFDFNAITDISLAPYQTRSVSPRAFMNTSIFIQKGVQSGYGTFLPAILTGAETVFFFERVNEAEFKWLQAYLMQRIRK